MWHGQAPRCELPASSVAEVSRLATGLWRPGGGQLRPPRLLISVLNLLPAHDQGEDGHQIGEDLMLLWSRDAQITTMMITPTSQGPTRGLERTGTAGTLN